MMKYNPKYMSRLKYKFIEMSKHSLFFRICNVDIISLRIRCIKWAKQEENNLYCFFLKPCLEDVRGNSSTSAKSLERIIRC